MFGRGVVVALTVLLVSAAACSGSDGGDDEQSPTLDRIDGPAQVDPSFDPFATDPSAPASTVGG